MPTEKDMATVPNNMAPTADDQDNNDDGSYNIYTCLRHQTGIT